VLRGCLKRSLNKEKNAAWWYADSQLYWVFLRPVNVGPENDRKQLGVLAVGYQVDFPLWLNNSHSFQAVRLFLRIGKILIASTLPSREESELGVGWAGQIPAPQPERGN